MPNKRPPGKGKGGRAGGGPVNRNGGKPAYGAKPSRGKSDRPESLGEYKSPRGAASSKPERESRSSKPKAATRFGGGEAYKPTRTGAPPESRRDEGKAFRPERGAAPFGKPARKGSVKRDPNAPDSKRFGKRPRKDKADFDPTKRAERPGSNRSDKGPKEGRHFYTDQENAAVRAKKASNDRGDQRNTEIKKTEGVIRENKPVDPSSSRGDQRNLRDKGPAKEGSFKAFRIAKKDKGSDYDGPPANDSTDLGPREVKKNKSDKEIITFTEPASDFDNEAPREKPNTKRLGGSAGKPFKSGKKEVGSFSKHTKPTTNKPDKTKFRNALNAGPTPPTEGDTTRLNKYMAHAGIASRRAADEIIASGEVTVNGEVVLEMGYRVEKTDVVKYKGKVVKPVRNMVYILLNKPKDYITTTSDELDRHTVMELVSKATDERVYPVGRLDRNTTGLLLMTNDGDLAQKLSHPSRKMKKIYHAVLDKPISEDELNQIAKGLVLEDGVADIDAVAYADNKDKTQVGIELHIGKNRIVRRIFEHLGFDVVKLDRVYYGGLTKKDLPRGRWRYLEEKEVIMLKHFI